MNEEVKYCDSCLDKLYYTDSINIGRCYTCRGVDLRNQRAQCEAPECYVQLDYKAMSSSGRCANHRKLRKVTVPDDALITQKEEVNMLAQWQAVATLDAVLSVPTTVEAVKPTNIRARKIRF